MSTIERLLMHFRQWFARAGQRSRAQGVVSTSHLDEARVHRERHADPLVRRLRETGGL